MIQTYSAALDGLKAITTEVEVALQRSTPQIILTGLPGDVVRESRERIRACLGNLGFQVPKMKAVIHLSPATAKKRGSQYDLAIAMALLASENHLPKDSLKHFAFLGELSLDGRIQPVEQALSLIDVLERDDRIKTIYLPEGNAPQAALLGSLKARAISNLGTLINSLKENQPLLGIPAINFSPTKATQTNHELPILDDVRGLGIAKRTLVIALSGRHHFLMAGPPGTGKSLLASTVPSLLTPLSRIELTEVLRIKDLSGQIKETEDLNPSRPFRAPHHTSPTPSLLGGGTGQIRPGEISLAHHGVLFLDELPEFKRDALEGLREPLQNGYVSIARTGVSETLPARTIIIAAMNPCPCGFSWEDSYRCHCSPERIRRYQQRLSGPLLDRFALFSRLGKATEKYQPDIDHSSAVRSIQTGISQQMKRFQHEFPGMRNGDVAHPHSHEHFQIDSPSRIWLEEMKNRHQISLRRLNHTIKVARTIADLELCEKIRIEHVQEAWSYRCPTSFIPFCP